MYYKIENKESEVYKNLYDLRTKELQIAKENISAIEQKTGLTFTTYFGNSGQQNFWRVPQFKGFIFDEPDKVCSKTWNTHETNSDTFIPNRKTKLGREMAEFLSNGLQSSNYNQVFDILSIEHSDRFTFPYVEIVGDLVVLYLKNDEPVDENVIEITKKEFDALLSVA